MSAAAFEQAKAAYFAAKQVRDDHAVASGLVLDHFDNEADRIAAIDAVPCELLDESERLDDLVFAAEAVLMEVPSPDTAAFAFKFLIAFGAGREETGWCKMLEAEAKIIAAEDAQDCRRTKRMANGAASNDGERQSLEGHFARWKAGIALINGRSATEAQPKALWADVDNAEKAILESPVKSVRAAQIRLWVVLEHITSTPADCNALLTEDLASMLESEQRRDWEDRMLLGALVALQGSTTQAVGDFAEIADAD